MFLRLSGLECACLLEGPKERMSHGGLPHFLTLPTFLPTYLKRYFFSIGDAATVMEGVSTSANQIELVPLPGNAAVVAYNTERERLDVTCRVGRCFTEDMHHYHFTYLSFTVRVYSGISFQHTVSTTTYLSTYLPTYLPTLGAKDGGWPGEQVHQSTVTEGVLVQVDEEGLSGGRLVVEEADTTTTVLLLLALFVLGLGDLWRAGSCVVNK